MIKLLWGYTPSKNMSDEWVWSSASFASLSALIFMSSLMEQMLIFLILDVIFVGLDIQEFDGKHLLRN
jgi:hypothetical protein